LRLRLGLKHERTVLYAPSWENHGKQDEFVQSLRDLPVNLLLKQAPWSSAFPTILANIRAMNVLHRDLADNIHVVDPDTSILHCLALSDVLVSDESSVLVEALLLDVPGLAVMDWLIPDCDPPRTSDVPFNLVIKTRRAGLRNDVIRVLSDLAAEKARLGILRDDHFGNLGRSSHLIMDAIDAAVDGRPCPYPALLPRMPTGSSRWLSFIGSRP
jgi:CDP-glycerol glycerophosphotransferase (TagB/SpsB family)